MTILSSATVARQLLFTPLQAALERPRQRGSLAASSRSHNKTSGGAPESIQPRALRCQISRCFPQGLLIPDPHLNWKSLPMAKHREEKTAGARFFPGLVLPQQTNLRQGPGG